MAYKTLQELKIHCESNGYKIGFSDDKEVFSKKKLVGKTVLQNSCAILPMEGNDANEDGSPSGLTERRYLRFAASGAALIWCEAIAVVREGRASPHQLFITPENIESFRALVDNIKKEGLRANGIEPCVIAQLTHSGRYAKPEGILKPIIAARSPLLDEKYSIPAEYPIIQDDELAALEEDYVRGAKLAQRAGFDGVDLKASHGYLLSELLSAFTREGIYGGSYEGRTRFLKNIIKKVRETTGLGFIIASRLSVYDSLPWPYGFGMKADGSSSPDIDEPVRLINEMKKLGVDFIGITMGNPYIYPHISRPYATGAYAPTEEPLVGVSRFLEYTAQVKKAVPEMPVVGAGYSYMGRFGAQAAAHELEAGHVDIMGIGRQAFAYPQFVRDVLDQKEPDAKKLCVACSKCTQIMRSGGPAGCVVRDAEVFMPIYRQYCK
jgi:2,4-dienoyl-CoA reductase (NADPH2)